MLPEHPQKGKERGTRALENCGRKKLHPHIDTPPPSYKARSNGKMVIAPTRMVLSGSDTELGFREPW